MYAFMHTVILALMEGYVKSKFSDSAKEFREKLIQENFFRDGEPSLKRSIIAFIDIMGFKNLIASGDAQENLKNIYSTYLKKINEIKDSVTIVKSFSDNILIVYPEVSEGALGNSFFVELADFQSELLKHGIIIRGAITIGDIHVGEDIIFGSGLVEAYKLESEKAIVSRIVLSQEVVKLCEEYDGYYADESPFSRVLLKDADGCTFLNYLHNPYVGGEEYRKTVKDYLEIHREVILSRLEEFSSNIRIFDKYSWLGNYHNTFCELHNFDSKISPEKLIRKIEKINLKKKR